MGTILPYVGALSDIPHGWFLCDGTSGTPDLRARFLEGVGAYILNTYVSPGLPNIWGTINNTPTDGAYDAFSRTPTNIAEVGMIADKDHTALNSSISFDASRCNSIYGASWTVQPPAYTVYYIIRLK